MKLVASPHDQLLYQDQWLQVGRFWVSSNEHDFAYTGPVENHVIVFPSLPVEIHYSHRESVVAEPMVAICYNRGCEYRRRALNPRGNLCWWFAYEDSVLADATGTSARNPFRQRWVPVPGDVFMFMRALVANEAQTDPDQTCTELMPVSLEALALAVIPALLSGVALALGLSFALLLANAQNAG
jgi:hypothetical protein